MGFLAITAFNLTDTFFVSRLGTAPLAAMGFTFPVVMVVGAAASGIAMGAGAILARCLGAGDRDGAAEAATHGLLLALALTAVIGVLGLATMDRLFTALGATEETLPLVKDYMRLWYAGCIVVVTPPVGDSNLRASGDMVRPTLVMLTVALANVVLDPLLIFGWGPIPAMGIKGAAVATVASRAAGMAATLTFNRKAGLLRRFGAGFRSLLTSWGRILGIGVPTAVIQLLPSALKGVLTAMAAGVAGTVGVAAIAAASRVESVPLLVAMAFNYAILTLTAQNFGAGRRDRVESVRRYTVRFSLGYGAVLAVAMGLAAPGLSSLFSDEAAVVGLSAAYLRIVFLASPGLLLLSWTSVCLSAVGRPWRSLVLNAGVTVVLMIPGAFLGRLALPDSPFVGMVWGLAIAYAVTGLAAWIVGRRSISAAVTT